MTKGENMNTNNSKNDVFRLTVYYPMSGFKITKRPLPPDAYTCWVPIGVL